MDPEFHTLQEVLEEEKEMSNRITYRQKLSSLGLSIVVHVGLVLLLSLVIIAVPREKAPEIVAVATPPMNLDENLQTTQIVKTNITPAKTRATPAGIRSFLKSTILRGSKSPAAPSALLRVTSQSAAEVPEGDSEFPNCTAVTSKLSSPPC